MHNCLNNFPIQHHGQNLLHMQIAVHMMITVVVTALNPKKTPPFTIRGICQLSRTGETAQTVKTKKKNFKNVHLQFSAQIKI